MLLRRLLKADRVLAQRICGKRGLARPVSINSHALKNSIGRPRDKTLFSASTVLFSSAVFALSSYTFAEANDGDASIAQNATQDHSSATEEEIVESSKTCNTILADRHRVSLSGRPIRAARASKDPRVKNLKSLFEHVWASGYDGIEISVQDMLIMYPKESKKLTPLAFASLLKDEADEHGIQIFGSQYRVTDVVPASGQPLAHGMDFNDQDFWVEMKEKLRCDRAAGAEYVTYQLCLPRKYMNTGGAYRNDSEYYESIVERLERLTQMCHRLNLNVYFETHKDCISEDAIAFDHIIQLYESTYGRQLEVNGNLSHYVRSGVTSGESVDNIFERVNHMHQGMARINGDIDVFVNDPINDWNLKGVTYIAFDMSARVLKNGNGLSSRTISGNSGPTHSYNDPLTNDAKMVPLLRAMCSVADGELDHPLKRNPFAE